VNSVPSSPAPPAATRLVQCRSTRRASTQSSSSARLPHYRRAASQRRVLVYSVTHPPCPVHPPISRCSTCPSGCGLCCSTDWRVARPLPSACGISSRPTSSQSRTPAVGSPSSPSSSTQWQGAPKLCQSPAPMAALVRSALAEPPPPLARARLPKAQVVDLGGGVGVNAPARLG